MSGLSGVLAFFTSPFLIRQVASSSGFTKNTCIELNAGAGYNQAISSTYQDENKLAAERSSSFNYFGDCSFQGIFNATRI